MSLERHNELKSRLVEINSSIDELIKFVANDLSNDEDIITYGHLLTGEKIVSCYKHLALSIAMLDVEMKHIAVLRSLDHKERAKYFKNLSEDDV